MVQLGTNISLGIGGITVITGSGLCAVRLAGGIVITLVIGKAMLTVQGDIHSSGGQVVGLACFTVHIPVPLPVTAFCCISAFEQLVGSIGYGDLCIISSQGLGSEGNIVSHILAGAVCIMCNHLHAGIVKGLADAVHLLLRLLRDFQRSHTAAQTHHAGGVVLEVQIALTVSNGAADGILCFVTIGSKENVACFDGSFHTIDSVGHGGSISVIYLIHTLLIPDHTDHTGRSIVDKVHVYIAIGVLVSGGQQAAGLRITHRRHGVGNGEGLQIDNRHIVTGEIAKLADTGNTHISTTVVDNGGRGAHRRCSVIVSTIIQVQTAQGVFGECAVCFNLDLVEVAALCGKVVGVGSSIVHNATALVTHIGKDLLIQQNTGGGMQGQNGSRTLRIAISTIVSADQYKVVASICACPVETVMGIGPGCKLGFGGVGGILIGHSQTDEVCLLGFAVPETGIDIAVVICDGAVGLTAQGVAVYPQRGQVFCVKGLHTAVGQCHEDHTVAVGG